ncbi:hypothetical protein RDABS01_029531 [Bienertia sinuspersici]
MKLSSLALHLTILPTVLCSKASVELAITPRNHTGALNLLQKMESHGHCMPNFMSAKRLKAFALNLFSAMKTKGIPPNVVTYNTLIRSMLILGQRKYAHQLFNEMLDNNILPITP